LLGSEGCGSTKRDDDVYLELGEFRREVREPVGLSVCIAGLE
jgi:hypothetical protein